VLDANRQKSTADGCRREGVIVGAVRLGLPADLDHARWCEIGATTAATLTTT
jgi:hypothetical protein